MVTVALRMDMEDLLVQDYIDDNGVKCKLLTWKEEKDGVLRHHATITDLDWVVQNQTRESLSRTIYGCSPRPHEFESGQKGDRHCAFCLHLIPKGKVRLCGKCKRRAYCSKECQTADWTTMSKDAPVFNGKFHGYGQGHKNWCGLEYGEEDLDFKVVPISGKGLGIVALRDLPPLYRIIVDGSQRFPESPEFRIHPAFHDLTVASVATVSSDDRHCPQPLDVVRKWLENSVGIFNERSLKTPLGLRISRVNHSCDPNAGVVRSADAEHNVLILLSHKEIKAGEEICYAYSSVFELDLFKDIKDSTPPLIVAKRILEKEWGIICPPSCICRGENEVISSSLIQTCLSLQKEAEARKKKPTKGRPALPKMEAIIEIFQNLGTPDSSMMDFFFSAADYAMNDSYNGITSDKKQARIYLEKYYNMLSQVWHPKDTKHAMCQKWLEHLKNE